MPVKTKLNSDWFKSKKTRPKTINVTFRRTTGGYEVEGAVAEIVLNQYRRVNRNVDPELISADLSQSKIRARRKSRSV